MKEDQLEKNSTKSFVDWLNFNVMPLFIFLFFVGVFVFFTLPQVREIFDKISEINQISSSVDKKDATIKKLMDLKSQGSANEELYTNMEELVPSRSTRVVEFKDTLTSMAAEEGLEVTKSRAGEIIIDDDDIVFETQEEKPLILIQIPTELSAKGTILQFEEFLTALYNSQDFFVVQEMGIKRTGDESTWEADFVIVKYQFDGNVQLPSTNLSQYAGIDAPVEVVDFLERKYSIGTNQN